MKCLKIALTIVWFLMIVFVALSAAFAREVPYKKLQKENGKIIYVLTGRCEVEG